MRDESRPSPEEFLDRIRAEGRGELRVYLGAAPGVGKTFTMLGGWIPDATLWLHDVSIDRRVLGRWYGTPTTDVAEVMAGWTAG